MRGLAYTSTALILLVAACTAGRTGGEPSALSQQARSPVASGSEGSLRLKPSPPRALNETVTGILGLAEIEGGCPYLEVQDGTQYEVLYPEGWELQHSPLQLVDPRGDVHARSGDQVTVRGGIATDMASICQIGPIFRATEVVTAQ